MNVILGVLLFCQAKTAEEAFKKIEETIEQAKTLSVRLKVEATASVEGQAVKSESSGMLLLKNPRKARFHLSGKMRVAGKEHELMTRVVTDGLTLEAENLGERAAPHKNIKSGFKPLLSRSGVALGLPAVLAQRYGPDRKPIATDLDLAKAFELSEFKMGEDEGGEKTLTYSLRMRVFDEETQGSVKVWYEPKTWRIARRTVLTTGAPEKGTFFDETYEEMVLDSDIPDERFVADGHGMFPDTDVVEPKDYSLKLATQVLKSGGMLQAGTLEYAGQGDHGLAFRNYLAAMKERGWAVDRQEVTADKAVGTLRKGERTCSLEWIAKAGQVRAVIKVGAKK